MVALSFGLLFVYWTLRLALCKRSIVQMFLAAISLILFLALPKQFELVSFLVIAALLTFSLIKHIRNKQRPFRPAVLAGWTLLYVAGGGMALLTTAFQHQDEQVIGHVILKGRELPTWMSWKNPTQPSIESAWMHAYEVEVQDAKGRTLFSDYLAGDYVGVRAQLILIRLPYHLLGFSHLHRLELVHNGYSTAQRHELFPHVAHALPFPKRLFEKVWTQLFLGDWHLPGVKSTTLESSYLPLRDAKLAASTQKYDLVMGAAGLSARASCSQ